MLENLRHPLPFNVQSPAGHCDAYSLLTKVDVTFDFQVNTVQLKVVPRHAETLHHLRVVRINSQVHFLTSGAELLQHLVYFKRANNANIKCVASRSPLTVTPPFQYANWIG